MAREPEGAAFAPVRVQTGSRRGLTFVAAWVVGLVGIAGLAAANVVPSATIDGASISATSSEDPGTNADAPPEGVFADRPIAVIDVRESNAHDPDSGETRRRLEVAGRLLVRADRVRVTLEGREDRILGTVVRQPIRLPPRDTPAVDRAFVAVFELPPWRSGGMWITVTALDEAGRRIGRIRERIEVYPLAAFS